MGFILIRAYLCPTFSLEYFGAASPCLWCCLTAMVSAEETSKQHLLGVSLEKHQNINAHVCGSAKASCDPEGHLLLCWWHGVTKTWDDGLYVDTSQ